MFRVLLCVEHQHDWRLVALAVIVCAAATLATFFLYARTPAAPGWRRAVFLGMSGLVAGSGIWTTHFVAMLAFRTGLPTGYAVLPTAASLGVAVLSTTAGFALATAGEPTRRRTLCGGLVVGLGITFMHYVGMSGYRTAGRLTWDLGYVAGSVLVGGCLAAAALAVAGRGASRWRQVAAAGLLTLGIVGMHFTGMSSVTITPDPTVVVSPSSLSNAILAGAAVAVTALILITALAGAALDAATRHESEERFRRLAVNAPDIIAEAALDGTMTYVSPACLDITGFAPEQLVGRKFASLMEPADAENVLAMCQAVFASGGRITPWPVEFRAKHKDGGDLWLECKPTLAVDAKTGRYVGLTDVIRDITPRKALEADLRAARADAEAAAAVKGEFLANMSHELRTPLTSIVGFTGLAAAQPGLAPLARQYIDLVADASRALLCTVNDILDFSKLEAGQVAIHPQPTRLAKLTRPTLDLFTPQAGAKDLTLLLDDAGAGGELAVMLDPDRVRQVLLNLVSNAVKFTMAGSVTLRVSYDAADETLLAEVIDTGAGIAADEQGALFKRFSQIDGSLSRSHAGTGLGLAICKGLVEAMGGEIGAESTPGQGSRFWFRIPAPPAALVESAEASASPRTAVGGVRVLVADDHASNRQLARLFLGAMVGEVSEAEDGVAAVRMAAEQRFDVILMDLRMPTLDGLGALQRIRAEGGLNAATPILAFTADATDVLTQTLIGQGFDGVVAKPIEPGLLIAAVAQATQPATGAEDAGRAAAA